MTLTGGGRRKCSIKSRQQKPATAVKGRRRCGEGRGGEDLAEETMVECDQ